MCSYIPHTLYPGQVIYLFIQIWIDRAVSELLDAHSGPEAWCKPSVPSATVRCDTSSFWGGGNPH